MVLVVLNQQNQTSFIQFRSFVSMRGATTIRKKLRLFFLSFSSIMFEKCRIICVQNFRQLKYNRYICSSIKLRILNVNMNTVADNYQRSDISIDLIDVMNQT